MGTYRRPPRKSTLLYLVLLLLGACLGTVWAMSLDEESKRRLKKTAFELRELPFRVFI
jgi:hypothetical protein